MKLVGMGVMTVGAMLGEAASQLLGGETHISMATMCAVGGIVLPATWWLSWKFSRIHSRLEEGNKRFDQQDAELKEIKGDVKGMLLQMQRVPCLSERECHKSKS